MRTIISISAGVLTTAVVGTALLGSAPAGQADGRPPMHALAAGTGPGDLEVRASPRRDFYGVMEGQLAYSIAAPPPTTPPTPTPGGWIALETPGTGNSAGYFNAVRRDAAGLTTVWLPGLDPAGAVMVTATGSNAAHCKTVGTQASPATQFGVDVQVACFDPAGNPVDAGYSVTYTRPAPRIAGSGGWVRGADHYNSTGAANTTTRLASGSYLVRMPGLGGAGGQAQVSAIGSSNVWCKASRWYASGADQIVLVKCFTPSGAAADSTFSLIFARGTDAALTSKRARAFYASSTDPAAAFVTPSGTTGAVTFERVTAGRYRVRVPLDITGGAAHVTAYGEGPDRCKLLGWSNADGIQVMCSADTPFAVAWSS